jgi:putative membrane protein
MDWGVLISLVVAEGLYLRALRILAGRGVQVPRGQIAFWHTGIALWVIAFFSPIGTWADELLVAHMAEHLLLADLGAPLLLAGARWPVLMFLLPRPALKVLAARRGLRRVFRWARGPLPAAAIYVVVLYFWHIGPFFVAAVHHPFIHALQHASFVAIGILVWWGVLDPQRRRMHGALWKVPYFLGVRFMGMMIGMAFVIVRVPLYTGAYGGPERPHGFSVWQDQQLAGAMMVSVDLVVMVVAMSLLFLRAAQEHDRDERAAAAAA